MTKEAVYVGVDVSKGTLDVAVSNSPEAYQFTNDHEGIAQAVLHIASHGSKSWKVTGPATGQARIMVISLSNSASDISNADFAITP